MDDEKSKSRGLDQLDGVRTAFEAHAIQIKHNLNLPVMENVRLVLDGTLAAEDAIDRGLTALPILEAGYGPDHPNVAACLLRLARASGALERVEDVDAYLRRAEAIAETRRETDGAMLAERCAEIREMFGVG